MRYKIKYYIKDQLAQVTTNKFKSWNDAEYHLVKVLKYELIDGRFRKHNLSADIVGCND